MTMYAYDYDLFYKAQISCAWMFDYGVVGCGLELDDFYGRFIASDISRKFERGDSSVVAGMSGIEMAMRVISESDEGVRLPKPIYSINRSEEYWLGWVLSYYQWNRNMSFRKITEDVSIDSIALMYKKYHEMDIRQFADHLDIMRANAKTESSLKRLRMYAGLSQSELAQMTDISVRTIQAYEQRRKNINTASVDYLIRLARALHCDMEMLIEKV